MPRTQLRSYQARIVSDLVDCNGIIVLPTGSGKTLISASVVENCLRKYREKKVLFLVPTCILVSQQASALRYELNIPVAELSGKKKSLMPSNILVSTPASFIQRKHEAAFDLTRFSLIVFDEVHHVVKNHPYRKISQLIASLSARTRPYILGLTASVSYAVEKHKILAAIQDLRDELNIEKILTADEQELIDSGYDGNSYESEAVDVVAPSTAYPTDRCSTNDNIELFLDAIVHKYAHPLTIQLYHTIQSLQSDINIHFISLWDVYTKSSAWGPFANEQAKMRPVNKELWCWLEHLYEAVRLIVNSKQQDLELAFRYIDMIHGTINLNAFPFSLAAIMELEHLWCQYKDSFQRFQKLKLALLDKIQQYGRSGFHGIVFVQQRLSTHIVEHFVSNDLELKAVFATNILYASSTAATASYRISPSEAERALKDFATGRVNLLISTSVSEEGLDVPEANVVLRFDAVQTPVSLVQSRGRARASESTFMVMHKDTSAKKSFAKMQQAQLHQAELLASDEIMMTRPRSKRLCTNPSSSSRRTGTAGIASAMSFIRHQFIHGSKSSFATLNEFAAKAGATIETKFFSFYSDWECCMKINIPSYSCKTTKMLGSSKKVAKHEAADQLLRELIDEIN